LGIKAVIFAGSLALAAAAAEHERGQTQSQSQSQQNVRANDQVRSIPTLRVRQAPPAALKTQKTQPEAAPKKALAKDGRSDRGSSDNARPDPACGGTAAQPVFRCGDPQLRMCREGVCDNGKVCGTNELTGACGCH